MNIECVYYAYDRHHEADESGKYNWSQMFIMLA